ncbi:MAG TPA: hypothetical protein VGN13_05480 [Solirubrobacteraceae bacterium]|jgi:hypothetical protein
MTDQLADTTRGRVVIKTPRGRITVGPHGQIDGLWRVVQRELRTNDQVRELAGGITRHTLIAWRKRSSDPFPAPAVTLPPKLELWSRTQVEAWLQRR